MRKVRPLLFVAALTLGAGCESGSGAPPPATYVLEDGTTVGVDSLGAVSLTAPDGHRLAATASGRSITAHRFDDLVTDTVGFFRFRRLNETVHPASRFLGSERTADGVRLRFEGDGGVSVEVLVSAYRPGVATRMRVTATVAGAAPTSLALPFACDADASFAGFGEQYNQTDQRGEAFGLWTQEQGIGRTGGVPAGDEHTTYFPMPWWIDWRGFGVLVDTPARTVVDLCAAAPDVAWVEVEDGAPVDVLVFHGPRPADLVRALGDEVGRPPRAPDWAFSPWIGMQGGRDVVLAKVAAVEAAGIPFSTIWVQDWVGGRRLTASIYELNYRWIADDALYPDLAGLVRTLRADHGLRFLAYANSFVIRGLDHFDEMAAGGMLIRDAAGAPATFAMVGTEASLADFTSPDARAYVRRHLEAMVRDLGFDGWMADFGEWMPTDAVLADGTSARRTHNLYPAQWHHASREVMDALRPDGDWAVFSRSGWTRDHAEHQIVWVGDQEADFRATDGLPTVVPAMLNLGLSAVPNVTHDIAGFSGGPSTKELYLRWVELGAFTPVMRTHEGLMPEANWSWDRDAETTAHFRRFARIHEALGPEIRALADEAARTSAPMLRHLAYVFPDDPGSRRVSDELMLGDTLLVAPVVTEGATSRSVYLPPGHWFHVWTDTEHDGGRTVDVDAPIGSPPVFSLGRPRPDLRAIGS